MLPQYLCKPLHSFKASFNALVNLFVSAVFTDCHTAHSTTVSIHTTEADQSRRMQPTRLQGKGGYQ